jgi:hypothetical protein
VQRPDGVFDMIKCYYTKETLDRVAKSGRYRAIGCGGFLYGWFILALIVITVQDPALWLRVRDALFVSGCAVFWFGILYFFHRLLLNIERTTLKHAGDEITLDDDEIRLVSADGTKITLPRYGLKIYYPYYATGSMIFTITNPGISKDKIVLTSNMENARELIETIKPGSWDEGDFGGGE